MDDERLRVHLQQTAAGMPETMYITLMPTLACNLACTYCFQKDSPAFNRMTSSVESGTVRWVLDRVSDSGSPQTDRALLRRRTAEAQGLRTPHG